MASAAGAGGSAVVTKLEENNYVSEKDRKAAKQKKLRVTQ